MREQLCRSKSDRILGGVAAGMAERFDWDTTLVRVGWVAAAAFSAGTAVLIYLVAWIVMPAESHVFATSDYGRAQGPSGTGSRSTTPKARCAALFGFVLLLAGLVFLPISFGVFQWIGGWVFWAFVMIAAGAVMLVRK